MLAQGSDSDVSPGLPMGLPSFGQGIPSGGGRIPPDSPVSYQALAFPRDSPEIHKIHRYRLPDRFTGKLTGKVLDTISLPGWGRP
jgi:hypothetical protein